MSRPSRSQKVRRLRSGARKPLSVRLEPRGRALLIVGGAILIAAYVYSRAELLYLSSLLMGLPLVALATVRFRRRRMEVSRRFTPLIAEAGRSVTVSVNVRNLASTGTEEATWRDEWPWAPFSSAQTRLPLLARHHAAYGAGSATVSYTLGPPTRGIFDIGPFVVEARDPFQVARGEMLVGDTQKLVVTPRVIALPVTGLSMEADDGSAWARQRLNSAGGDDIMTREYRHGDALRRVHWKATARRGELMVRLEEQRSHAQASIVLDTRRNGYRDAGPASDDQPQSDSFEWSVAFTASLAIHLQNTGFTVEVIETGYRQLTTPEHRDEFLGSLASVTLVEGPPPTRSPTSLAEPGRSLGSAFAIVADAESTTIDRLVSQRSSFDSAFAFVVNPRSKLVLEPLRNAGWTCVTVRSTDDLADAWLAAAELRGANRARG